MNKQVNPHWLKSLAVHVVALMVAAFIGRLATVNNETPEMVFHSLWVSLISPLIYPLLGPYMVAFLLATHIAVLGLMFWAVVFLSYVAYFALLLVSILEKDRSVRVVGSILLAVWFVLVLMGLSEVVMFRSV